MPGIELYYLYEICVIFVKRIEIVFYNQLCVEIDCEIKEKRRRTYISGATKEKRLNMLLHVTVNLVGRHSERSEMSSVIVKVYT